jgi:uncharacterized RDD family membrane protein YckC
MNLVIRRLLAFGLDYVVIAGYLVALAGVSLAILASGLRAAFSAAWATAWSAETMGFLMLTLPVVLYFAILESSTPGATLGNTQCAFGCEGSMESGSARGGAC